MNDIHDPESDTDENCDHECEAIMASTSSQSYTIWALHPPYLGELVESDGAAPNNEAKEQANEQAKQQARTRLNALYESKMPFFTKKAFQGLLDDLKSENTAGDIITIKDLTGAPVRWKVRVGMFVWLYSGDSEVKTKSFYKGIGVNYRSRTALERDLDTSYRIEDSVFSPLRLMHRVEEDDSSKEILDDEAIIRVIEDFREKSLAWEESEACKNFKSILSSFAGGHDINKIVGLACGSLALPQNDHAAFQTAMLVTVRSWLKERDQNKDVPCYIQDPMNTPIDQKVLAGIKFEMIDDPRGWLEVDECSVVLSVAPNVPVKEIIADTARPAVLIWYRVENEEQQNATDPDSAPVREMMEGYDLHEFVPEERPDKKTWEKVVVYIRKSTAAPTPNQDGRF